MLGEIKIWHDAVENLWKTATGEANLKCIEPNLEVSLRSDSMGHINMKVSITQDHMTQKHQFQFTIDQSYLPDLTKQCANLLQSFPIKGGPDKK